MNFKLIQTLVDENEIDSVVTLALKMDKSEYKLLVNELIRMMESTADNTHRNTIAIILSDLQCNEAIEPLIRLINKAELANCRGTLISSLGNLDVAENLESFVDLLLYGNFEVRCNIYNLFEKQLHNMTREKKTKYTNLLRVKITNTEESLDLMYELYKDVFGGDII